MLVCAGRAAALVATSRINLWFFGRDYLIRFRLVTRSGGTPVQRETRLWWLIDDSLDLIALSEHRGVKIIGPLSSWLPEYGRRVAGPSHGMSTGVCADELRHLTEPSE